MANEMWKLNLRLTLALMLYAILFFITSFLILLVIGSPGGYSSVFLATGIYLLISYFYGPMSVERNMKVIPLRRDDAPQIYEMVEEMCEMQDMPMPKIGICPINAPNAFAYGTYRGNSGVCVTKGLLDILTYKELRAVIGHELGHIKHKDTAVTSILSLLPSITSSLSVILIFAGLTQTMRDRRNRRNDDEAAGLGILLFIIGSIMLIIFYISELIVLLVSRIREYYADQASLEFGNPPEYMASALYKLVYGTAITDEDEIREIEGHKAFFLNNVSNARREINDLYKVDLNEDGKIDKEELHNVKESNIKIRFFTRVMELISTHPDMLSRIKRLSEFEED